MNNENVLEMLKDTINSMEKNDADYKTTLKTLYACKEALEQPAQEPVGWLDPKQDINECFITHELKKAHEFQNSYAGNWNIPLYTHPHQWQGLTDDEAKKIIAEFEPLYDGYGMLCAIEQALKDKNT